MPDMPPSPSAAYISVRAHATQKKKITMALLIWDERDVLITNICFIGNCAEE